MSPPNPTQHDSSPGESCPTIAAAYPESRLQALVEVAVIVALLVVYAGGTPPAVNEAHYLSKARHYWDPNWCPNDLFLDSADAHWTFYWTVGWLANVLPLPLAAWCGRLVAWTLLAWGWQRLSVAVIPRAWFSIFSILLWLAFIDYGAMATSQSGSSPTITSGSSGQPSCVITSA